MYYNKIAPPGKKGAPSFASFVRSVSRNPMGNPHWMPFSARCNYPYTTVLKIEDPQFSEKLVELFAVANLTAKPEHANHLSAADTSEEKLKFRFKTFTGDENGTGNHELVDLVYRAFATD